MPRRSSWRARCCPASSPLTAHLGWLAECRLGVDPEGTRSLDEVLEAVGRQATSVTGGWVRGCGWPRDSWPNPAFPHHRPLDAAVGGRPALLVRKDGHFAWLSTAGLRAADHPGDPDPPGGVIDREERGDPPAFCARMRSTWPGGGCRSWPAPSATAAWPRRFAISPPGLTAVHAVDRARDLASLQRLHAAGWRSV